MPPHPLVEVDPSAVLLDPTVEAARSEQRLPGRCLHRRRCVYRQCRRLARTGDEVLAGRHQREFIRAEGEWALVARTRQTYESFLQIDPRRARPGDHTEPR